MPLPQRYRDAMVESRRRSEREAARETRRDLLRSCGHMVAWTVVGLGLMGLALHVNDLALGHTLWLAGQTAWIGGVAFALLAAYRRGERRGDW